MLPEELRFLLKKYKLKPRRELGQNFLVNEDAIRASIEAANIQPTDIVLEIGPGLGVLTGLLAERAGRVIAIEPDTRLLPALEKLQQQFPNLEIHNTTIQQVNLEELGLNDRAYKLVSNLPYSISSWVLRQFTEHTPKPTDMVLMLQKEVAERVVKQPGKMSILSCAVQMYAAAEVILQVPRDHFYPAPQVDSAILHVQLRDEPFSPRPEECMRIINMGFSSKRKQLHNNISNGLQIAQNDVKEALEKCQIEANARAQELSLDQWEALRIFFNQKV